VNEIVLDFQKLDKINNIWVQKNKEIVDMFHPVFPEFKVVVNGVPAGTIDIAKPGGVVKQFVKLELIVKHHPIEVYLEALKRAKDDKEGIETLKQMMRYEWTQDDSCILIKATQFGKGGTIPTISYKASFIPIKQGAITRTHSMTISYGDTELEDGIREVPQSRIDQKNLEFFFTAILSANAYLYHHSDQFKKRVDRERITPAQPTRYDPIEDRWHARIPRVVNLYDEYTLLDYEISNKKVPKARVWHVSAWSVRGHIRRYKSGKVINIEAYVKGKDKHDQTKIRRKVYKIK